MTKSALRFLALQLFISSPQLSAYAENGEQSVVSSTQTSEASGNSSNPVVISDGENAEPSVAGGSDSSGQGSSEQTESETVSGGFLGDIGFPEECADSIEELGGCFQREWNKQNMDCAPCLRSDLITGMTADPPQLPGSCEDVSEIICHLATCCEPCASRGRATMNCFNIEGGTSPDGEQCEIKCDTSTKTRDSGATTRRSRDVAIAAASTFCLAWTAA